MDRFRAPLVLAVLSVVLFAGLETSVSSVKAVAGILMVITLGVIFALLGRYLGVRSGSLTTLIGIFAPIATLVVVGFFLSLTHIGITARAAALVLLIVALGAAGWIAQLVSVGANPFGPEGQPEWSAVKPPTPILVSAVVSAVVFIAAVAFSVNSANRFSNTDSFTTLSGTLVKGTLTFQVYNHEGDTESYSVVVANDSNATLAQRSVSIGNQQRLQVDIGGVQATTVSVKLFRPSQPSTAYRTVTLNAIN